MAVRFFLVFLLLALLLNIQTVLADSEFEEKFKNKLQKLKDAQPKTKDKIPTEKPDIATYAEFSKKISKSLIKAIKDFPVRKSFEAADVDSEGRTSVYVYVDDEKSIPKLPPNILIAGSAGKIAVTKLSLIEMNEISQQPSVLFIGPVHRAVFYPTEGVALSGASAFHSTGLDGTGVKVAVIDDSFFVTDPAIASNIVLATLFDSGGFCGDISCGMPPGGSHGTAVAEIVVDMAPDVDLLLYAIGNSVDFENAVDDAILNGADIITASLGFPTMGGDGTTGSFRDGTSLVAKKVNEANTAGILFTVAAGNQGVSHWMGNYVPSTINPTSLGLPPDYETVMEFSPGAPGKFEACLPVTDFGDLYVTSWNEWTTTFNDFDFYLYDGTMTTILTGSAGDQTLGDSPFEAFFGVGSGPACLVIASWQSVGTPFFHMNSFGNPVDPAFQIRGGSIDTPADASGAFSIGAIDQSTLTLEDFSSSGPTDDGRKKPEMCGYDGTTSSQSGLNPFFGTSSATPHVAGAAAVLLEENPSLTVSELKSKLQSMAIFDPSYSVDNLCDSVSGRLFLTASTCGMTFSSATISYGSISPGDTGAEIPLTVTNPGSVSATVRIFAGGPWVNSATSTTIMPETSTHYTLGTTPTGTSYDGKTPLTTTSTTLGSIAALGSLDMVFQLRADLTTPLPGTATQDVVFEATCP